MSSEAGEIETKYHIPVVAAAGSNVVSFGIGANMTYNTGMPIRFVGVPFPFSGQPRSVIKGYVQGKDTVTGKPMMQAIVDGFTKPLTANEQLSGIAPDAPSPEPRLLPPDTEDNLQALFKDRCWTDFNPVIMPTEERVAAMLKGTSHKADEIVKSAAGTFGTRRPFTVEKVAVIAVMAGAKPEYFPVILALASMVPYQDSTTSIAQMIVLNGPIRKQIGMNSGLGALGPDSDANSVIGRSMTLIHKIIQGYDEGITGFASLSNPLRYDNLCIAENEESLPAGWQPFHVQMGHKANESIVTIFTGWNFINSTGWVEQHYAPQFLMRDYMSSLSGMGATILMDPSVAELLNNAQGFTTKAALGEWLSQNVEKTAQSYWGNSIVSSMLGPLGAQGLEPYASWKKLPGDTPIKPFGNARNIHTVVVGGKTASVWFATDFMPGRGVSIDDWT
ncbi:MAG TPA: hypothetical protein VMD77_14890 [Candidatus Baltobacteraceae bacterium]|nr:hypothetical protein [Candidatus Baltobacteraceae bacterium]